MIMHLERDNVCLRSIVNEYGYFLDTGWERMVLQILFLGPSNLLEPNATFAQMSQKLIVSPIVKTLVFSKVPEKVNILERFYAQWMHFVDF